MIKLKNKTVILNASEGSMDSSAKAIRMTQESGRSMVEMLGVLAVIGVLSIAGIAGYTTAMKNHKANEILNAASVRAMFISSKLQQNSGADITSALSEFTDNTVGGATFGGAETAGISQFKINFTTPPDSDVCTQMQNTAGTGGIIRSFGTNCDALTFNNDLTTTDPAPTGPTGDECTTSCTATSGTATCVNGYCECTEGMWQPSGAGTGTCKTSITNGDCTKNSDCASGEYCAITSSEYECEIPDTGTCTVIGSGTEIEYNNITFVKGDYISWWSARNWCLAQGKSLASLSDLGCTTSDCSDWSALQTAFGYDYYWTSNSYNSCYAFYVYTYGGNVDYYIRYNDYGYYALCK